MSMAKPFKNAYAQAFTPRLDREGFVEQLGQIQSPGRIWRAGIPAWACIIAGRGPAGQRWPAAESRR